MEINITRVVTPPTSSTNTTFSKENISKINTAIEWYNQTIQVKSLLHAKVSAKFTLDNYIYKHGWRPEEWYTYNNSNHKLTPKLGGIGSNFHSFSNRTVNIEWLYNKNVTPRFTSTLNNSVRLTGSKPIYTIVYNAGNIGTDTLTMTWTGNRGREESITATVNITDGNFTLNRSNVLFVGSTAIHNTLDITQGSTGQVSVKGLPSGYSYNYSRNRITITNSNTSTNRNGTFRVYTVSHGAKSNPQTVSYQDIATIETNASSVNMGTNNTKTITITNYSNLLNYTVNVPDQQLFTASISGNTITIRSKTDDASGLQPSTSGTKNLIINASLK